MSITFRHCFLFPAACAMAGLFVLVLTTGPALARNAEPGETRNQVRMDVDFTVLPKVLPDGSEAPASSALSAEEQLAPEPDLPGAPEPETPAPAEKPAADAAQAEPAPAPEEQAEVPAVSPVPGTGVIRTVALDENARGFSLDVIADRPLGRASFMNLDNPRRLVVDIQGKWTHKGGNVLRSEGTVKHVIMGEHPDHFRMVVHFRTPPQKPLTPEIRKAGDQLHVLVALP
jgi:hypothetical protein